MSVDFRSLSLFRRSIGSVNFEDTLQDAAKDTHPLGLQKSHCFQNNLIFLVKFSEVIHETLVLQVLAFLL